MKIEVERHWINLKYFVVVKNNYYAFSSFYDNEFFDLFKRKIIDFEYMKNNFNVIFLNGKKA